MRTKKTKEMLRIAEVYSHECYRLLKLLDRKLDRWEKLNEYFVRVVDETTVQILAEWDMEIQEEREKENRERGWVSGE